MKKELLNPYAGNLLIDCLPPIPDMTAILERQTCLPKTPANILDLPFEIRMHHLLDIWDNFWIPSHVGSSVIESIDHMIRYGYKNRHVADPKTWAFIYESSSTVHNQHNRTAIASSLIGIPGVGKSKLIARALGYYPQIKIHSNFPNILNEHYQMVWQSVEVGSGKLSDFAYELMRSWDQVLMQKAPGTPLKFARTIALSTRNGDSMYDEWLQAAKSHFLGILHIDEVQNFFDIPSLKKRQAGNGNANFAPKVKDDKLLKNFLNLTNSGLPILISGTPDGISFLTSRFSTSQRISTFGANELTRYEHTEDREYLVFLGQLMKYQYVKKPLTNLQELAVLMLDLTAGIKRLIIALWIEAHKCAYRRARDDLLLDDFKAAESSNFKMIRPAINAVKSGNPRHIEQYMDLLHKI